MQFSEPQALWLLLLGIIPFIVTALLNRRYTVYLSSKFQKIQSQQLIWLRTILVSCCIVWLAVITANPIRTEYVQNPLKTGLDILFVLDLSKSMLAEDIAPNRINAGKRVLSTFIQKRSQDRIWLIGFSGKPFVFSPLTFDHTWLISIVSDISVDSIKQEIPGFSGTAIGDALLLASDAIKSNPERKKVIILLTDGEANIGIDPKIVNEFMKKTGVVIHTIGIGDPAGTLLYVTDAFGKKQYFMDAWGVPIRANIDEPLLKKIAADNGGVYANAASLAELQKAIENLDALYGVTYTLPPETIIRSFAPYVSYAVIFLLVIWLCLELFSVTGAFHVSRFSGISLTWESTNYRLVPVAVWSKRILLTLGVLVLGVWAIRYHYASPLGSISIMIDGSKSMLVADTNGSRFDLAKEIAKEIIKTYAGSPIRILLFWGDLTTITPSSYDTETLLQNLESIPQANLTGGSDIVGSLRSLLTSSGDEAGTIFLISDGEVVGNRTQMKNTALSVPQNISIWTFGVGTIEGGNIPMGKDIFWNPVFKQVNGAPVVSKLSEELLQKIAINWGKYQPVPNIESLKLEKVWEFSKTQNIWSNFLMTLGSILILVSLLLPYRKRIIT